MSEIISRQRQRFADAETEGPVRVHTRLFNLRQAPLGCYRRTKPRGRGVMRIWGLPVPATNLRIAFFTNAFPIASEPFIELQAAELIRRGHEVHVFGLSGMPASLSSSSEETKNIMSSHSSNVAWPAELSRRLAAAVTATYRTYRKAGLRRLPIIRPMIFRRTWADLSAVFQADLVAGHKPFDVLHCQFATLGEHVIKLRRAGLLSGALIIHFRGYDITDVVHAHGLSVYNHLWQDASGFVTNCQYFRRVAVNLGCPADRIEVIGSGIDLSDFLYRPPVKPAGSPVRALAVGRLSARKGFHSLIQAIATLRNGGLDIELGIVGDGEERQRLAEEAKLHGVSDHVVFYGRLPHSQIRLHLQQSHIFVAPSETSPTGGVDAPLNTIKEAMAVGVPVCATRHGGIPEIVEDGVTGTLANEADPQDLAHAIKRLLALEPHWDEVTRNACNRVTSEYGIRNVTDKLLAAYERAQKH